MIKKRNSDEGLLFNTSLLFAFFLPEKLYSFFFDYAKQTAKIRENDSWVLSSTQVSLVDYDYYALQNACKSLGQSAHKIVRVWRD